MPSPFPGMDPYVEPRWRDAHSALAVYARRALNRSLPAGLIAQVEERVEIDSDGSNDPARRGRHVVPDVGVFGTRRGRGSPAAGGQALAPIYLTAADDEPAIERFVKIVTADDSERITVIEFVSPSN